MHPSHPNPRLHGCDDLKKLDTSENDRDCLQVLQRYHAYRLGAGARATVVQVSHKIVLAVDNATPLAVKIITNSEQDAVREIVNACRVNDTIASVPWMDSAMFSCDKNPHKMFCQTFGYIKCNGPPPVEWQSAIGTRELNYKYHKTNWYLIMEVGTGVVLEDLTMAEETLVAFVFELFFTLAAAHHGTQFRHKDLHMGNIIVYSIQPNDLLLGPRSYTVAGVSFQILSNQYPKIIDFGSVTFGEAHVAITYDAQMFLIYLRRKYLKNKKIDTWIGKLLSIAQQKDATFIDLLHSTAFESIRTEVPTVPKMLKSLECHVCGRIATRAFEHVTSFAFCDWDGCVKQMGPIANLISK